MRVFKIQLSSWTASFRYPNLISGFQPTLKVPPLSTVLGICNAAAGKYLDFNGIKIAYSFTYDSISEDLETIYQIENDKRTKKATNSAKSNIMRREILSEAKLTIYLTGSELAEHFRFPRYPLVLGRSDDLATVKSFEEIELKENLDSEKNLKGQIIPLLNYFLPGEVQALPVYFTEDTPRSSLGVKPFTIIDSKGLNLISLEETTYVDTDQGVDLFFHSIEY